MWEQLPNKKEFLTHLSLKTYGYAFMNDEVVASVITRHTWGRLKQSEQRVEGARTFVEIPPPDAGGGR